HPRLAHSVSSCVVYVPYGGWAFASSIISVLSTTGHFGRSSTVAMSVGASPRRWKRRRENALVSAREGGRAASFAVWLARSWARLAQAREGDQCCAEAGASGSRLYRATVSSHWVRVRSAWSFLMTNASCRRDFLVPPGARQGRVFFAAKRRCRGRAP